MRAKRTKKNKKEKQKVGKLKKDGIPDLELEVSEVVEVVN